ncbi:MAG: hypothetical protein WC677_07635 [Clostridia bacterium]|jgi:hypothetical protein
MFTTGQIWKIEDAVSQVKKHLRNGWVDGSNAFAFDEGHKLFLFLDSNLYTNEMFSEFQSRLDTIGILSEKVYYGAQMASSLTPCVVFWKKP